MSTQTKPSTKPTQPVKQVKAACCIRPIIRTKK